MKLVNPDDGTLNGVFAEEVAGWVLHEAKPGYGISPTSDYLKEIPDFVSSVDLVLPWLEKNGLVDITFGEGIWSVITGCSSQADCKSFPRAAVIALLRAHGIEVEFT